MSNILITRWVSTSPEARYQNHGFSEASSCAYSAAIYLRIDVGDGRYEVSLQAAKIKVAPTKTISIPDLELCGAVLLIKLLSHAKKLHFHKTPPVCAWSDSLVVLSWLQRHPCHFKTFVVNRVALIQTELPLARWSHVSTKENLVDLTTRVTTPPEIHVNDLWWHGSRYPKEIGHHNSPVRRVLHIQEQLDESEVLTKLSLFTRLIRILAYCRRPLRNLQRRQDGLDPMSFVPNSA